MHLNAIQKEGRQFFCYCLRTSFFFFFFKQMWGSLCIIYQ